MKRTDAMPKPWLSSASLAAGDDVGVVGETEVVVGAEIQHLAAVGERDLRRLRAGDDALGLNRPCARIWSSSSA
jgi:hypothetical protein